ncbi:flavoprotein [compost metagenome]
MPDVELSQLVKKLQGGKKQSLTNIWRKAGLDTAKINLIREVVDKALWNQPDAMAQQIKALQIKLEGFRPIEEAISCAGGIKQEALSESLNLKEISGVFCCGEMLDWDAPTGGYLLTACFATGRAAGQGVHSFLER